MKQTVVITGPAAGIGREVALQLAKDGDWNIAGFDIDSDGVKTLEAELESAGVETLLEVVDITDHSAVRAFRDRVLGKYDHVDVVLSNAGIGYFGPFEEVDLESARKSYDINVWGCAIIFQAFLPHMRERRKGRLVAVSSLVGQIPFPFESIYSSSKFAVEGMVHSMRLEVEPYGLKVAMIHPSQVSSKFAAKSHVMPEQSSPYYERVKRFIDRDHELIKGAPTPSEAAKEIVKVVKSKNPKLETQIEFKSTLLLQVNKLVPPRLRDNLLLNHMGIND